MIPCIDHRLKRGPFFANARAGSSKIDPLTTESTVQMLRQPMLLTVTAMLLSLLFLRLHLRQHSLTAKSQKLLLMLLLPLLLSEMNGTTITAAATTITTTTH